MTPALSAGISRCFFWGSTDAAFSRGCSNLPERLSLPGQRDRHDCDDFPPPPRSHCSPHIPAGPPAAPSSPVHTLRPVFSCWTGLPAAPALVAGVAAAVPAEGAAGAVKAVAAPLAQRPPKPSLAFALARLLGAGREVAGAFEAAPPAPPARQAAAVAGEGVAVGAGGVALTLLLAGGCPPARLAAAGAGEGVAAAVGATLARELAEPSPVVGVAGAVPAHWVAAPVGVARAAPLAVGAPVLLGAACEGKEKARMGGDKEARQPAEHPGWQRGWRGPSPGEALTGTAVCSEEARFAEANPRSHAHLVRPAGILPLAQRCRHQGRQVSAQWPPLGSNPFARPLATRPPPAFPGKPPSHFLLHPSGRAAAPLAAGWVFGGPHSAGPH